MPEKLHDAARALARQGIPVFPCLPGTKFPAIKAWQRDCTTDIDQIDIWWGRWPDANIGIVPDKAGWCVLDVDNKNGVDGSLTLTLLEIEHGLLPETYTVRTPSGGRHLYFRGSLPASQGKTGLGPGLDTRGRGSYVLAPPSRISGREYRSDRVASIVLLPEWITQLLKRKSDTPRSAKENTSLDTPLAIDDARHALKRCPIPGPEGDGDDFALFARCKDLGVSQEKLLDLCFEAGSHEADKDWIEITIANAWKYGQNDPGSDARDPAEALKKAQVGIHTYKGLFAHTPGPVGELIPGLVERQRISYLVGTGGMHKSRIGAHWGLAVHAGHAVYGKEVEKAHFVHLSWENGRDEDARRAAKIADRLGVTHDILESAYYRNLEDAGPIIVVSEEHGVQPQDLWWEIAAALEAIPGHKFVVIDSLYNAIQFIKQAKIDETLVREFINWMDAQCRKYDFSGLMLQHPSRAGAKDGMSGYSESWNNAPRIRLTIDQEKDSDIFTLKISKRNNAIAGGSISLKWADGILDMVSETESRTAAMIELHEAAIELAIKFADQGHPLKTRDTRLPEYERIQLLTRFHRKITAKEIIEACSKETVPGGRLVYHQAHDNTKYKTGFYPAPGPGGKGFD